MISDDELMAYLDGELSAEAARAVESLAAKHADLARRVSEQQVLRNRLRRSFNTVLDEPVPSRLTNLHMRRKVVDIAPATFRIARRSAWTTGVGLAAGVLLGVLLGPTFMQFPKHGSTYAPSGADVALGSTLDDVLTHRLASEQRSSDSVRIGVSFLSKHAEYCRTFTSDESDRAIVGLACRRNGQWQVDSLQALQKSRSSSTDFRQAATSVPPRILETVNAMMSGEALDDAAEAAARSREWKLQP